MPDFYRISWEAVRSDCLWKYSNANPLYNKNTKQIVPNSQIPDEDWFPIKRTTDEPWQQFRNLREWAVQGKGFVRNVKLEKMVSVPMWKDVTLSEVH